MRVRKQISQREALRLRKRVNELIRERSTMESRYAEDYPGGAHVATVGLSVDNTAALRTAVKLSSALVAKFDGQQLRVFAIPNSR